jgi:cell division protein FtsB
VGRNQRTLATALLVGVLLLVAVGAVVGSKVLMAQDRLARQRATERGLLEALAQTETYLGEGDKQLENPVRWQMTVALAEGAARRAEELLMTGEASAELAGRWRRVRGALDAARRDSGMLVELDRIHLEKAAVKDGYFDYAGAAPRYAKLLFELPALSHSKR